MKQILITILAIMAGTLHTYAKAADKVTITVTNPINLARSGEMIETDITNAIIKLNTFFIPITLSKYTYKAA